MRQSLPKGEVIPRLSDSSIFCDEGPLSAALDKPAVPFVGGQHLKFPVLTRVIDIFTEASDFPL